MKDVFTGSSGSVGQYISNGFLPLKTRLEASTQEMKKELEALKEPLGSFLHLAAMTLVSECEQNPERAYKLNVEGTAKWFEAAAKAGANHFVFLSTSHVYGKPKEGHKVKVTDPTAPGNVYGRTKLEAEKLLTQLSSDYPDTKLTIARMFSVLSPVKKPGYLFTNMHIRAQNGDFSPVPGLHYYRDFMDVTEAARQLIRLCRWHDAPPIVNVCSGEPRKVLDIAKMVFSEYGLDANKLEQAPASKDDVTWMVGEPTPELRSP